MEAPYDEKFRKKNFYCKNEKREKIANKENRKREENLESKVTSFFISDYLNDEY